LGPVAEEGGYIRGFDDEGNSRKEEDRGSQPESKGGATDQHGLTREIFRIDLIQKFSKTFDFLVSLRTLLFGNLYARLGQKFLCS